MTEAAMENTGVVEVNMTSNDAAARKLRINQQNYLIACGLSVTQDAVQRLSDFGVEIKSIAISDNIAYLQTSPARFVPGVSVAASVIRSEGVRVRAILLGAVLEWSEPA